MAIGDCFSVNIGTATTDRQPASGVFEQISAIVKGQGTDGIALYDGTNTPQIYPGAMLNNLPQGNAAATRNNPNNLALLIGNTVYVRKEGTSDRIALAGVQVDA